MTHRNQTTNRKLNLALALLAMTLALGVLGGNLRQDINAITDWSTNDQILFTLCVVDAVIIGWRPIRDFLTNDWKPFINRRLQSQNDEK